MKRGKKYEQYEVHSALREDLNEGWIWIGNNQLEPELNHRRRIVRINKQAGKSVYCEALYLDDYYVSRFNDARQIESGKILRDGRNLMFINGWYRECLGVSSGVSSLSVEIGKSLWWQVKASLQHPQVGVFLTTVLTIIALGLGAIGIGLALWSPKSGIKSAEDVMGMLFGVLGAVLVVLGLIQPYLRSQAK